MGKKVKERKEGMKGAKGRDKENRSEVMEGKRVEG